jgi:hypothetical protein
MRGLFECRLLGDAHLPHPPIMEGVLRIIEMALGEAWRQTVGMLEAEGFQTGSVYEDQLTEVICKQLNYIRLQDPPPIPGFSSDQFETVQRESNWRDCQNSSIDKQPDLVFKFSGKRQGVPINTAFYDGLFVECKPIDRKHPINKHYLDKGLRRFVNGTYAWAMQDAMMLGYVSNDASIVTNLLPLLAKPAIQKSLNMSNAPTTCQGDTDIGHRCQTHHRRDCVHPHAGPIRVRHLWLK